MPEMKSPKIAFIINFFPVLSETFIFSEFAQLLERGMDLTVFALFKSSQYEKRDDVGELGERVVYLSPLLRPGRLLFSHLGFMLAHPVSYCKTLGFAIRHSRQRNVLATAWQYLFVYKRDRQKLPKDLRQDVLLHFMMAPPFARLIRKGRYDIIHAHYADSSTSFAMLLSRLCGLPFGFTTHATDLFVDPYALPLKIDNAAYIVTCTEYNRKYIVENIKDSAVNKVFLNYHGVDVKTFQPPEKKQAVKDGPLLLLSVGRLVEKKGFDLLLQACAGLKEHNIAFECHIIGNGPLLPELEAQRDRLDLTNTVKFIGAQTPQQVFDWYTRSDVFVLPCRITARGDRDGIPNVIAEAMAMELPVVSTTVSGIPEVIEHGISGYLVPPEDVKALLDTLVDLAANPDKRLQVGVAARQHISSIFDKRARIGELADFFSRQLQHG